MASSKQLALCQGCPWGLGRVHLPMLATRTRLPNSRSRRGLQGRTAVIVACNGGIVGTGPDWWTSVEEDGEEEDEKEGDEEIEAFERLLGEEGDPYKYPEQAWRQQAHPSGEDLENEYLTVRPDMEGLTPDSEPLERQVGTGYLEALQSDEVRQEDADYWFSTPPGGWNYKPQRLKKIEGGAVTDWPLTAENFGDDRIPLSDFKAGQIFDGEISAALLYHGARVDIGGEYDGMVPITVEQWQSVAEEIPIGKKVKVRVWKVYEPDLFRWPLQLEFLEPNIQDKVIPADSWMPPVDQREIGMKEILERTGRKYDMNQYFLPVDAVELTKELNKEVAEEEEEEKEDEWDPSQEEDYVETLLRDFADLESEMSYQRYGLS